MRTLKLTLLFFACLVSASYAQTAERVVQQPDAPALVEYKAAMAKEKALEWEEAIAQFDQISQKYSGTPEARKARIEIGRYYKYKRDWQRAVAEYQKVVAEAPHTREAHDAMTAEAVVHWFRNDFRRSRDLFEAVLKEATDWDQIKYCSYWFRELNRRIAFEDRQQFTCGPKSLRIALNKLGIETEDKQFAALFDGEQGQVSLGELVRVASAKGVTPKVVKVQGDGVLNLDTPFIASVQLEHYVVVMETGENKITYIDPTNESDSQTKSLTEFNKEFRGYALVFLNDKKYAALRLPSDDELHDIKGGVCWCCALGNLGCPPNALVKPISGCPTFGMPGWSVNTVTMNLIVEDIDLSYVSRGMPVQLVRTYNADDPKDGPFGRSWTFNFNISLVENADTSIDIRRGDGRIDHFFWNGTKYQGPEAIYDTVVKNGDGTYVLTLDGSRTVYNFSAAGVLQSIVDRNGNRISLGYDGNGRLVTITDPNGKNTTLTYGANNKISKLTAPDGRFATYFYDAYSNLIQSTDMVGATSAYGYDGSSYMTSITTPQTGTTTFTYSANHLGRALDTMTDALGNRTKFTYVSSRNIMVTDPKGNGTLYVSNYEGYTETVTSPTGNKVTYEYDSVGNLAKIKDGTGNTTTMTYDGSGRALTITDPLNNKVTLGYDSSGNLVSATDSKNKVYTFTYDSKSNLLSTKDPTNAQVNFAYNNLGQVARLTDTRGGVTDFTYDVEGKLTQMKDPLGKITAYTNDMLGRPTGLTDPNGKTFSYQFDGVDHLTKITNPDSSTSEFLYNCCHLIQAQDAAGVLQFTYDTVGRITQFKNQDNKTLGYKYDSVGNLIELTYPDGKKVTYEYDSDTRLLKVKDWLGNETKYTYDKRGKLSSVISPGLITVYFYDAAGRVVKLINYNRTTMAIISGFEYTMDQNSNRNLIKKLLSLTAPAFPAIISGSYTYNADNQMLTAPGQSMSYDANGNMVSITGANAATLVYNQSNQLTQYTSGSTTLNYQYDAIHNRIKKTNSGVTTKYIGGLVEMDAAGSIKAYYVYGLGLISTIQNGVAYYYQYDGLGSTVAITDTAGAVKNKYAYGDFGQVATNSVETIPNAFKYVGKYGVQTDAPDLFFMQARYYMPSLGRFINKDPIGFEGGFNQYSYAENNPIRWIDPSGLIIPGDPDPSDEIILFMLLRKAVIEGSKIIGPIIKGCTKHGINRLIERGITPAMLMNILRNAKEVVKQIDEKGRTAFKIISDYGTVVINKAGEIVSAWCKTKK